MAEKSGTARKTWISKRSWITLAALVGVIAVVASAFAVSGRGDSSQRTGFCAMLPDTIGLYKGNAVTRMGYQVGKITSIKPYPDGTRVQFSIDSKRSVPADVKAVTRSKSILADRSLELVGDSTGPRLEPGDCISVQNSYTPRSISEITGSAADLIEAIAPDNDTRAVEGTINALAQALDGTGPSLAKLMKTAGAAAKNPEATVSDIGAIILNTAPLTTDALDQWSDVASIISKLAPATQVGADVLWPGAVHMIYGMQPVLLMIYKFEPRYGKELYGFMDIAPPHIHVAATQSAKISKALEALPVLATQAAVVSEKNKGAGIRITVPQVRIQTPAPKAFCRGLNTVRAGSCIPERGSSRLVRMSILDLLVAGGRR